MHAGAAAHCVVGADRAHRRRVGRGRGVVGGLSSAPAPVLRQLRRPSYPARWHVARLGRRREQEEEEEEEEEVGRAHLEQVRERDGDGYPALEKKKQPNNNNTVWETD